MRKNYFKKLMNYIRKLFEAIKNHILIQKELVRLLLKGLYLLKYERKLQIACLNGHLCHIQRSGNSINAGQAGTH